MPYQIDPREIGNDIGELVASIGSYGERKREKKRKEGLALVEKLMTDMIDRSSNPVTSDQMNSMAETAQLPPGMTFGRKTATTDEPVTIDPNLSKVTGLAVGTQIPRWQLPAFQNYLKDTNAPPSKPEDVKSEAEKYADKAIENHPLYGLSNLTPEKQQELDGAWQSAKQQFLDRRSGKKAVVPKPTVPPPAETAAKPIFAINRKTNERIQSIDGGKTWQKAK